MLLDLLGRHSLVGATQRITDQEPVEGSRKAALQDPGLDVSVFHTLCIVYIRHNVNASHGPAETGAAAGRRPRAAAARTARGFGPRPDPSRGAQTGSDRARPESTAGVPRETDYRRAG